MKLFKPFLIGIFTFVTLFLIIAWILPSSYSLQRTRVINASIGKVFLQINDIRQYKNWCPWLAMDSTHKIHINPTAKTVGQGATYDWTSQVSGSGKLTIKTSQKNRHVATHLDFGDHGEADAFWDFTETDSNVSVSWTLKGDVGYNPFGRYMILFMESMVGTHFELGLDRLNTHIKSLELPNQNKTTSNIY